MDARTRVEMCWFTRHLQADCLRFRQNVQGVWAVRKRVQTGAAAHELPPRVTSVVQVNAQIAHTKCQPKGEKSRQSKAISWTIFRDQLLALIAAAKKVKIAVVLETLEQVSTLISPKPPPPKKPVKEASSEAPSDEQSARCVLSRAVHTALYDQSPTLDSVLTQPDEQQTTRLVQDRQTDSLTAARSELYSCVLNKVVLLHSERKASVPRQHVQRASPSLGAKPMKRPFKAAVHKPDPRNTSFSSKPTADPGRAAAERTRDKTNDWRCCLNVFSLMYSRWVDGLWLG